MKKEINYRELFQSESEFLNSTVESARDWVRNKIMGKGCICPVCDKFAKVYPNRFYAGMALPLIWLYKNDHTKFIHVARTIPRNWIYSNKTGYLVAWGVAQASGAKVGEYRITQEGIDLVEGKTKIRKTIYMYKRGLIEFNGMDKTEITIQDALDSDGFTLAEVMQPIKGELA